MICNESHNLPHHQPVRKVNGGTELKVLSRIESWSGLNPADMLLFEIIAHCLY